MRAPSKLQFHALLEVWRHARGAENLVALISWVRTRFGEGGGQLDRRRARGVLNLCARESKARTGRVLREKMISDHGLFSSYEGQQGATNGQDSWGFFRDAQGFRRLGAGSRAGSYQLKASTTLDLGISIFLISA